MAAVYPLVAAKVSTGSKSLIGRTPSRLDLGQINRSMLRLPRLHNSSPITAGTVVDFGQMRQIPEDVVSAEVQIPSPNAPETLKRITLTSPSESTTGQGQREVHSFTFDRVLSTGATQSESDGESEVVHDGDAQGLLAGVVPQEVEQAFCIAAEMKSKGWEYTIEGQSLKTELKISRLEAPSTTKNTKKYNPKTGTTHNRYHNHVSPLYLPSSFTPHTSTLLRSVAAALTTGCVSRSYSAFALAITWLLT
ncbi:hypothetical protein P691DRAFT_839440 [Macrolepiota fuliginosa MF-IS2]|uniref:Uncharacterized protein n=1 Tax=Macrolepiota fuliginosa MF-IS2 TaxID=1400762 RepID=A0A9P6C019_9AGAR|nr:hypothetical protein P691DRAFT_839440 [Macrolepiota fuliginosa MF-IS2]